ncbi:MAG: serine/threonine protein kinase [Myxococcaceae bacterium]|nr:serine/threonine protein kinase [Myxococcaceae bacterium]
MSQVRYQPLGPLLSGEGSRAFLGLALEEGAPPRPVVLIWAPQEVAQDADLTDKLRRETQRAVVFEHPNILRVHGLVSLEQGLARVTEYADGETLRRVMEVTPRIPPPLAAKIVADAAMGIHYAHMAGNDDGTPLVHGDIRPETLIISYQGAVKVTGYGALGVAPRERGGRRVRNRRKYSAPEQLLGGRDAHNIQTDVFLMGLTLYELLTGKIPFKDAKDPDTATLTEALPPLPLTVPRALDTVVHKATAKRANERYPTALALREAIVEAMGDLPPQDILQTFMNRLFPPTDEARMARTKVLELGIAEAVKQAGARKPVTGSAPTVAPSSRPPSSTRLPVAPSAAAPMPQPTAEPAAAQPPAPEPVPPTVPPRSVRSRLPLVFAALAALISVIAIAVSREKLPVDFPRFWGLTDADTSRTVDPPDLPIDPLELADAGSADAGTPEAGMEDAGTDGGVDAGTLLELIVDPRVEALLPDGGTLGRTPLTAPMPPGRHVLSLSNPGLGVNTARAVLVGPTGQTTVRLYLGKGFVNIRAPEAATVLVDGRNMGYAPVEELDLYEGHHRLVVIVDGARWTKSFSLEANQRVTFTVGFEDEGE